MLKTLSANGKKNLQFTCNTGSKHIFFSNIIYFLTVFQISLKSMKNNKKEQEIR